MLVCKVTASVECSQGFIALGVWSGWIEAHFSHPRNLVFQQE